MLRGVLDVVTSSGYVEGWATDTDPQAGPVAVAVCMDEEQVARGLAHRYRADLAEAGCGTGWCAFRLRVSGPVGRLRRRDCTLLALPGREVLFQTDNLRIVEDVELPLSRVDDVARADPTLVGEVGQLRCCGGIFDAMIARAGPDTFVRAAFVYALGRPADATGLDLYSRMLITGDLTPFELLEALCGSEEFRAQNRLLIAPTEPGFIFAAL
jgi:hypothetical protein